MNWTKTELPDGRSRQNSTVGNLKASVYDSGNGNIHWNLFDSKENEWIVYRQSSETVESAKLEAEQHITGVES